jgi:DNA end-binding protein Ku
MSARPISSATLSFGLVSVPVEMYPTYESAATISFNMINPATGARVKQELVDAKTGEKVDRGEVVKGYEFAKGQYVTFTKDEMKALEAQKTESIDIHEFVPMDQVDRLYFDRAYYLGAGKGGDRAYLLLAEALRKTKLAAIGQYNARGKAYLVMLRAMDGALVLETLHYADEIRSVKDIPVPEGSVKESELKLATQLIEQARSDEFKPEKYEDEVHKRMLEQIEHKVAGKEITAEPTAAPETQVLDLMEALKKSLAGGGGLKGGGSAHRPAKRAERAERAERKPAAKAAGKKVRQLKRKTA